jgi:hypothetical protein
MQGWHKPTVLTTVVAVVAIIVLYHFTLGRKKG